MTVRRAEPAGSLTSERLESEGTYTGAGGVRLFRRVRRPAGRARGVVINLHGLGDHSGLYPDLTDHLAAAGFVVHAADLRGNGRSPGQRGYVGRWEEFREDLHALVALVRSEEPGLLLFLMGNSLGGLIVLDYALAYPEGLRGVIAVAPPLGSLSVPAPLLALGRIMSRIWPRFSVRTGMDLSGLAKDPAVRETVLADPRFHRRGTARLSTEVVATIARVQAAAPRFPVPLLILHGSADRMVTPEGSRDFIDRVGHPDHELREYPEGYHALFADHDRARVLDDLERWIVSRL
jgi:alpha-beta hydrolase superfamily lysophospholipase